MPTPPKAAAKMGVGRKGGGKHSTAKEVEARKSAADKFKRKEVKLTAPKRLSGQAKTNWNRILREMAAFDVLDNIDADLLAVYCETLVRYEEAMRLVDDEGLVLTTERGSIKNPAVTIAEAASKICLQMADKLGLTPSGRARLALKIAQKEDDPNEDVFDA